MYIASTPDDPTDEQVEKQCSDIVVNDITIPVDTSYGSNIDDNSLSENKVNEERNVIILIY